MGIILFLLAAALAAELPAGPAPTTSTSHFIVIINLYYSSPKNMRYHRKSGVQHTFIPKLSYLIESTEKMERIVSLPIIITKEGKWFVASCPILDIATQGKSEGEVKENMGDLIKEYLGDPDTYKPPLSAIISASVAMATIPVKIDYVDRKTSTPAPA